MHAETRDRAGDLQIFSLTLSQLSYRGLPVWFQSKIYEATRVFHEGNIMPWLPRVALASAEVIWEASKHD